MLKKVYLLLGIFYLAFLAQIYVFNLKQKNSSNTGIEKQFSKEKLFVRSGKDLDKKRIQRAIVIFYPTDQEVLYLPELRWLFRTWIEIMNSGQSKFWRTDLVIFAASFATNLRQLGCKFNQTRKNIFEQTECRVFPYIRISDRYGTTNPLLDERSIRLNKKLDKYVYVDSINVIAEGLNVLSMYDYILKTDIDVFLTPYFASYIPIHEQTFLTGLGGYSDEFNNRRLYRVSRDMNWFSANMTNIGSTWYGSPKIAHKISSFTIEAMLYLYDNEFTEGEKDFKLGALEWPQWHYGVLSMYGTQLAINHLVVRDHLDVRIADELFDQQSNDAAQDGIDSRKVLHLHCWHGHKPFSKYDFKKGLYNNITVESLVYDTGPRAYAMRMALESKNMSLTELRVRFYLARRNSKG